MTIWKRERTHFNYYITNERKQPHIYVEALGTPSASTEKVLFAPDIQEIKDICYYLKVYKCYVDILNKNLFKICKPGSKSLLATYNTSFKTIDVFNRNKLIESYVYNNGKIEKMIVEKAAPKKKKAAPALTEQQKINKMLEDFEFPF